MYCLCVVVPMTDLEGRVRLYVEDPGVRLEGSVVLQPELAAFASDRKGMRLST
jgi:hypothetical protein